MNERNAQVRTWKGIERGWEGRAEEGRGESADAVSFNSSKYIFNIEKDARVGVGHGWWGKAG